MKNVQFRGHCQCCGKQQAVLSTGRMSKHGYTVDHGWFNGICQGEKYAPMEKDRSVTDKIVSDIRAEVATMEQKAVDIAIGKITPKICGTGRYNREMNERKHMVSVEITVPFAEGDEYHQARAVKQAIYQIESRIRLGKGFSNELEATANLCHLKEFLEVAKKAPAPYIQPGEKRRHGPDTRILTAKYQDGPRVYYTYEGVNGKIVQGWAGTASWRKMGIVA